MDIKTSYVLADSDWLYLHNGLGEEFRYDTLEEAKNNLQDASDQTDIPMSDIIILKETREEIK